MRPHEVLLDIAIRIDKIPDIVWDELKKDNPRGFACSASLRHIKGIIMSIDKLDPKYDGSMGLTNPSKVLAGEGLDIGDAPDAKKNTETQKNVEEAENAEDSDDTLLRKFFDKPMFVITRQKI